MKGDMALDYVFKVLITVVTIAVVIALIIKFSDDIKKAINDFICNITGSCGKTQKFPKNINQDSFATSEVVNYIDSCLATETALPENDQKDIICYILFSKNTFASSGVTATTLQQALPQSLKDSVSIQTDFSHDYLKIQFQDLGNKIVVS
jgi:hypothetical protein